MSALIRKGVLLNHAATAPSPSKDYCQVYVTLTEVIYRRWKITLRASTQINPTEIKDTHEEFLDDSRAQMEIRINFGQEMLDYVKRLAGGHIDYIVRLQKEVLIKVLEYVDLEDVQSLMRVCRPFREVCASDELWEQLYRIHTHGEVTDDLETLAEAIGWQKLFFTNKLQLQVMLKRLPGGGGAPTPDIKADDADAMSEVSALDAEHVFLTTDSRATSASGDTRVMMGEQ